MWDRIADLVRVFRWCIGPVGCGRFSC